MALNKEKSVMGVFAKITNHHPHWAAKKYYVALLVEFAFGDEQEENELFFTENEYNGLVSVDFDLTPFMKRGHLYLCKGGGKSCYYVEVKDLNGAEVVVKLPDSLCRRALKRAENNPEDVRPRGFLRDLLD